jgi:hypothetical protein
MHTEKFGLGSNKKRFAILEKKGEVILIGDGPACCRC